MKNVTAALAIAGGALAGVALGMLLSPKKGEDLRSDITKFVRKHCPFARQSKVDRIVEMIRAKLVK